MKKWVSLGISLVMMCTLVSPVSALDIPESGNDTIVEEYSVGNSDIVFTMDLFEETFTRQDIANIIAVEKATNATETNQYRTYSATEAEIDALYDEMEEIAARAPALVYYFSRVYWRYRTDPYYGANTISLTLVPTNVTKNNWDREITLASWALVKAECGNSQHWTNEGSLFQQFECHAYGERFYPGDIGDWDLEPIRPDGGLFEFLFNKCNPTG